MGRSFYANHSEAIRRPTERTWTLGLSINLELTFPRSPPPPPKKKTTKNLQFNFRNYFRYTSRHNVVRTHLVTMVTIEHAKFTYPLWSCSHGNMRNIRNCHDPIDFAFPSSSHKLYKVAAQLLCLCTDMKTGLWIDPKWGKLKQLKCAF